MSKYIARALAAIAITCSALAMHGETYVWPRFNLSFTCPDGGFMTYQSNNLVELRWSEMNVTMRAFDKQGSSKKVIRERQHHSAAGYNMYDVKEGSMRVNGFKTYSLDGTMPDGSRCLIATLVSSKSNLLVEVTINYLLGSREMADDIVKSIAEGKPKAQDEKKHKQKVQSKKDAEKQEKQRKEEEERRKLQRDGKLHEI